MDARLEKLADLLVNYSVQVQPRQKVAIAGSTLGEPLLKQIYVKVLQAGAYPSIVVDFPDTQTILYQHGSDHQLEHPPDIRAHIVEAFDVAISVRADANTKALSNVPASTIRRAQTVSGQLTQRMMDRAALGGMNWVATTFPTNAYAQDAEMSLREFEDFVYTACLPDLEDPVEYWQQVSARQAKIIEWLESKREIHVIGPGTDLRMNIEGRKFMNAACQNNVPDGEIYTAPIEDSVNGHVSFSYPAINLGREVSGVRLWFEDGEVVKATAEKNEGYLHERLKTDPGAKYLGEFAIGTNKGIDRFIGQILFDEKIGGTFHIALGRAYPQTGGQNRSSVHWDMICDLRDGGEIRADGELFHKDGEFIIGLA